MSKLRRGSAGRRVMIINSGGTFGLKWSSECGAHILIPNYLQMSMKMFPMFHDTGYSIPEEERTAFSPFTAIALPLTHDGDRILYCINEYSPLMDSSDMNLSDWVKLAKDVEQYYHQFDAFVLIHGTDTLCYTASALSFIFDNLSKPVIVTGAQVPFSDLRNDARENLMGALILAGSERYHVPEVCVYFNNKLLRGNRSTKISSAKLDAFDSPNLLPLATVGAKITVNAGLIPPWQPEKQLQVSHALCNDVALLKIFPGMSPTAFDAFLQPPMKGVVLQTFGAGHFPSSPPLLSKLQAACDRGMVVVNCTQCIHGSTITTHPVHDAKDLDKMGAVLGGDMTAEAALAKLAFLLGRTDLDVATVKKLMSTDIRGELTCAESRWTRREQRGVEDVALIQEALPLLMCAAAAVGDTSKLTHLMGMGGSVAQCDYDGRSPLHLAASEGHSEAVKFLIQHGAPVNQQDRFNHTPLHDAIHFKRNDVIKILVNNGANISSQEFSAENASKIQLLRSQNDAAGLSAWREAGTI